MPHPLKRKFFALTASLATLLGAPLHAQDLPQGWQPRSGDGWVDAWLGDINRYGARYREPFVDEMVRYYGAPRELVGELLDRRRWTPGDVYYACAIAQVLGRPCRYVVDEWDRDHAEGWGAVAQRLGIKPGSADFHKLKRGFVPTYDRWGRPIVIDSELRRDFPNRPFRDVETPAPAKAKEAAKGKAAGKPSSGKAAAAKAGAGKGGSAGASAAGKGAAGKGRERD